MILEFGIKDFFDILIVAFILYYIYTLLKESSSANIFTGIILFLLLWVVVSQIFEMRLLGTILDKMVNLGGLALIILFQEDIRRFLSGISAKKYLGVFGRLIQTKDEETIRHEQITTLVLACLNMSKNKQGALIVLERSIPLGEYIETGVTINADIVQSLIENIFFKNSPLHDGALIITNHKLKAAGCILPVSHEQDIPKSLGLRHRSALGISLKSDALAIVVSEETGNITVAMHGELKLRLSPEELESLLSERWT